MLGRARGDRSTRRRRRSVQRCRRGGIGRLGRHRRRSRRRMRGQRRMRRWLHMPADPTHQLVMRPPHFPGSSTWLHVGMRPWPGCERQAFRPRTPFEPRLVHPDCRLDGPLRPRCEPDAGAPGVPRRQRQHDRGDRSRGDSSAGGTPPPGEAAPMFGSFGSDRAPGRRSHGERDGSGIVRVGLQSLVQGLSRLAPEVVGAQKRRVVCVVVVSLLGRERSNGAQPRFAG